MHITLANNELTRELSLLDRIVPKKPVIPILADVLIQAKDDGIWLSATDTEIGLSTACKGIVKETGTVSVNVHTLLDLVRGQSGNHSTIVHENGRNVFSCGSFRSSLLARDVADYPQLPVPTDPLRMIPRWMLRLILKQVRCAISDKPHQQYMINGANIIISPDRLTAVAVDHARLAMSSVPAVHLDPVTETSTLIPTKTVDAMLMILEDAGEEEHVFFDGAHQHIFLQIGQRLLFSRKIDGEFPAYTRIIPTDIPSNIEVTRTDMLTMARRHMVVDPTLKLTFATGVLNISSVNHDVGDSIEQLPIAYDGPTVTFPLRGSYLIDFLESATSARITIGIKDELSSLVLRDKDYLQVLVAMRNE